MLAILLSLLLGLVPLARAGAVVSAATTPSVPPSHLQGERPAAAATPQMGDAMPAWCSHCIVGGQCAGTHCPGGHACGHGGCTTFHITALLYRPLPLVSLARHCHGYVTEPAYSDVASASRFRPPIV